MARAGSLQTSFLGGIWSPFAQGRADVPAYKTALNEALNSYPIEEGAIIRRPGTAFGGVTFNNVPARIFAFDITGSSPIQMEVTAGTANGRVRFWYGNTLCYDYVSPVTTIQDNGSGQAEIIITNNPIDVNGGNFPAGQLAFQAAAFNSPAGTAPPWQEVQLIPLDNYTRKKLGAVLNKRTFVLQGISGSPNTFYMLDQFYNSLPMSQIPWDGSCKVQIQRVCTLQSPYTNLQYHDVRFVMCEMQGYFLHPAVPPVRVRAIPLNTNPLAINNLAPGPNACQFLVDQPQFVDGPYLDPPTDRDVSGVIVTAVAPADLVLMQNGNANLANIHIQLLPAATELPNGQNVTMPSSTGVGFLPTDVGRLIRWFIQPPTYAATAVYSSAPGAGGYNTQGNQVTYPAGSGSYFLAIGQGIFGIPIDITGKNPADFTPAQIANYRNLATLAASGNGDTTPFFDAILLDQPFWCALPDFFCAWENWGTITVVEDSLNVIVSGAWGSSDNQQLLVPPISTPGLAQGIGKPFPDPAFPFNTPLLYQLGVYSATTGYPKCGCWHEGRLWLGGGVPNFFCASVPNGIHGTVINGVGVPANFDPNLIFSPTDLRGDVNASCGIDEFVNSQNSNEILWMVPVKDGIMMGTSSGEWIIQATNNNEPLTPTSVQAHRVTRYGCANIEARPAGQTVAFVQKETRRIHEFFAEVFGGRHIGPNLTEYARNLTFSGIRDIAYQEEMTPILWSVLNNGELLGCTYRRISMFSSEPPKFMGWHRHLHGAPGRAFEWISAGSSQNGLGQAVTMITLGPGGA
jgi:hypothetical protein